MHKRDINRMTYILEIFEITKEYISGSDTDLLSYITTANNNLNYN